MDPIQPIGPRPPWIAELAAEQTQSLSRERRRTSGESERKPRSRREPAHEQDGPEDDDPEGRHIDVHA